MKSKKSSGRRGYRTKRIVGREGREGGIGVNAGRDPEYGLLVWIHRGSPSPSPSPAHAAQPGLGCALSFEAQHRRSQDLCSTLKPNTQTHTTPQHIHIFLKWSIRCAEHFANGCFMIISAGNVQPVLSCSTWPSFFLKSYCASKCPCLSEEDKKYIDSKAKTQPFKIYIFWVLLWSASEH